MTDGNEVVERMFTRVLINVSCMLFMHHVVSFYKVNPNATPEMAGLSLAQLSGKLVEQMVEDGMPEGDAVTYVQAASTLAEAHLLAFQKRESEVFAEARKTTGVT